MTKKEFLTNCDFNNIDMESQIEKVMELVDNGIDTLPDERDKQCSYKSDKDGNPQEDGKYIAQNQELKEANAQLLIDFPNLENILRGILSKELSLTGDTDKDSSDIKPKLLTFKSK